MVQPAFATLDLTRPSAVKGSPTVHAIIPEDPIVPDPDDEIIDDPGWGDDEIIRDPDPLEPPIEEPPPGWGALGCA
jgi:hypothetical protein